MVNWTRGSGEEVIVLSKQGGAVDAAPVGGGYSGYAANPGFGSGSQVGSGNYVICRGSGTSVAVTGWTAGTDYSLAVYEHKWTAESSGVNQGTNYKPSPVRASQPTTAGTPG